MSTDTTTVRSVDVPGPFGPLDGQGDRRIGNRQVATGGRATLTLFTLAALVVGSIMLVLPVTASADALVSAGVPCVAYANAGATKYEGSGTNVITPNGDVALSCHLTLASGTAVSRPTSTTTGNCELLQLPSGEAVLRCHYEL